MTTQVQTTTNNNAERIIAALQQEQAGFRELFKTQKAFDKFKSNFRLMTVKNPEIGLLVNTVEGKKSLFMALFQAAHDGLMVDGKRSALVVFNQTIKDNGNEFKIKTVQYMPMVLGIREKTYEYMGILLSAHVVYTGDDFEWEEGDNPKLVHKPSLDLDDSATPRIVYAVARKDGVVIDRVVMRIGEINKIMRSSKSGFKQKWVNNRPVYDDKGVAVGDIIGMWKDHWAEMAKKTAVRRLAKQLPLVEKLSDIIERDDSDYVETNSRVSDTSVAPYVGSVADESEQPDVITDGVNQTTGEIEGDFKINPDAANAAENEFA